jgi:Diacylglycerol kinase catalytic domain
VIASVGSRKKLSRYGWAPTDRPRRPVLFVNPTSGGGKVVRASVAERAGERGIEVIFLSPGQNLAALVDEVVARGADALGVAGGDGRCESGSPPTIRECRPQDADDLTRESSRSTAPWNWNHLEAIDREPPRDQIGQGRKSWSGRALDPGTASADGPILVNVMFHQASEGVTASIRHVSAPLLERS